MIQFHSDTLWFRTPEGEAVPCSAEAVALEFSGDAGSVLDPEMVCHAAQAVLHYFQKDLGRSQVSVGEFAETLATVLRGLGLSTEKESELPATDRVAEADLRRLACEAGGSFELGFFSRLRTELHRSLVRSPRVVRFRGLRSCVKQLMGAGRWSPRCQRMNDQIVDYLRRCLSAEERSQPCSLVVV